MYEGVHVGWWGATCTTAVPQRTTAQPPQLIQEDPVVTLAYIETLRAA